MKPYESPRMLSDHPGTRPLIATWNNQFRSITTSLPGYGGTAERRTSDDASVSYLADTIEAVIRRAGDPVHLVGHSAGAMACLAVALRNRVQLSSLVVIEAPAVELLRSAGEDRHYETFRRMTSAYFAEFARRNKEAIGSMIDFYGGAGTFASWPEKVRLYAIETTHVNLLDWAGAYSFALSPELLGKLELPVLVIRGGAGQPAMLRANQLLYQCIPGASILTIEGAAHFLISTHAEDVGRAIADHVRKNCRGR